MSIATITSQQAERALLAFTDAVDEFRAAHLADTLAASDFPEPLRIVWLRDLYQAGDDEPQAWIVDADDSVECIDDAEQCGVQLRRESKAGSVLLGLLEDGDAPLRKLAVGEIAEVDNPNGQSGFVATLSLSYMPSESSRRMVATQIGS